MDGHDDDMDDHDFVWDKKSFLPTTKFMVRLIMIMIIEMVVTINHDVGGYNHCDEFWSKVCLRTGLILMTMKILIIITMTITLLMSDDWPTVDIVAD